VISADTESTPLHDDNNGAPKDCGIMDYSAYCHHSRSAIVRHTMVVQDSNGKTYTIACTVDTIWSNCASLPVGGVFSAEKIKRGIRISYPTAKGKEVKQSYALVPAADKPPALSASQQTPPLEDPADNSVAPPPAAVPEVSRNTTMCSFTSNPAGAEITLDGMYVGNTPSTIAVGPGKHYVVLAMSGFAKWKREMMVSAGSNVDVSATLQKTGH
jgi:hypothetical protein